MATPYLYNLEVIIHYGNGMNMEVSIEGPDCDTCYNKLYEYLDSLDTDYYSVVGEGWADEF